MLDLARIRAPKNDVQHFCTSCWWDRIENANAGANQASILCEHAQLQGRWCRCGQTSLFAKFRVQGTVACHTHTQDPTAHHLAAGFRQLASTVVGPEPTQHRCHGHFAVRRVTQNETRMTRDVERLLRTGSCSCVHGGSCSELSTSIQRYESECPKSAAWFRLGYHVE